MTDKDQHLLWEAYLEKSKPDHQEDKKEDKKGKYDDGDGKKERCDYVPCEEEADQEEDHEDKEVQEEMDNLEFSAAGRESPEQAVFNAVVSWMKADTEGLTTPEDYEGYSMSDAFDDAKEFIRDVFRTYHSARSSRTCLVWFRCMIQKKLRLKHLLMMRYASMTAGCKTCLLASLECNDFKTAYSRNHPIG